MTRTPTQQFCDRLQRIVCLLEQSDWQAAAAEAVEMEKLVATLPPDCPQEDVREARRLLSKYESLGVDLQTRTVEAMTQLGAAQRVRSYSVGKYRP